MWSMKACSTLARSAAACPAHTPSSKLRRASSIARSHLGDRGGGDVGDVAFVRRIFDADHVVAGDPAASDIGAPLRENCHNQAPKDAGGSRTIFLFSRKFNSYSDRASLQAAARVDRQWDSGDVTRFVGGQEQHRVADVAGTAPTERAGRGTSGRSARCRRARDCPGRAETCDRCDSFISMGG